MIGRAAEFDLSVVIVSLFTLAVHPLLGWYLGAPVGAKSFGTFRR